MGETGSLVAGVDALAVVAVVVAVAAPVYFQEQLASEPLVFDPWVAGVWAGVSLSANHQPRYRSFAVAAVVVVVAAAAVVGVAVVVGGECEGRDCVA